MPTDIKYGKEYLNDFSDIITTLILNQPRHTNSRSTKTPTGAGKKNDQRDPKYNSAAFKNVRTKKFPSRVQIVFDVF